MKNIPSYTIEVQDFKGRIKLAKELFVALGDTLPRSVKIFKEMEDHYAAVIDEKLDLPFHKSHEYMCQRWGSNLRCKDTRDDIRSSLKNGGCETAYLKNDGKIHLPPGKMLQNLLGKKVTFDIYR